MPPLNLYLIRHGIAAERNEQNEQNDFERELTKDGVKKIRDVAEKLQKLGLKFDLLQSSPLLRARQTAEIFAKILGSDLEISELLAPEGSFKDWLRWLITWQELGQEQRQNLGQNLGQNQENKPISVGIIGHEPDLSTWAEMLIFGEIRGALVLKKGGIIGISIPETGLPMGNSFLFLLIPPKLLT